MAARTRGLSIGAVLTALQPEFPQITVSKIRFLEAEGLVTPARTASGYRVFAPGDVERLRFVLRAQRDRFWPLKVIKDALDAMDRGLTIEAVSSGLPSAPAAGTDATPDAAALARPATLRLTRREVQDAASVDDAFFEALLTFGLLSPDPTGHFDSDALAVARAAGALAAFGVEPRHLRPFRTAADREIGLVEQIVAPTRALARRMPADDPTAEVLAQCIALHAALVRTALRRQ